MSVDNTRAVCPLFQAESGGSNPTSTLQTLTGRQTSLLDAIWINVRDGNETARLIFEGHYSRHRYADGRSQYRFVGPGERMVLVTPDALALFIWRRCKYPDRGGQHGANCAVFRNEGSQLSSDLIRAADALAWDRWPGERLYTYVNVEKIRHKRDPGRCFLRAGWRYCGWSENGLRILECRP